MNRFADGFLFGAGLTAGCFAILLPIGLLASHYQSQQNERFFREAVSNVPKIFVPVPSQPVHKPAVAQIGPAKSLTQSEQQEKACNLAILQFSQSNSDSDKQRVYDLCPDK